MKGRGNPGYGEYTNGSKIRCLGQDDPRNGTRLWYNWERNPRLPSKGGGCAAWLDNTSGKTILWGKNDDEYSTGNNHTDERSKEATDPVSFQSHWRKLDIPVFVGEEAYGWTTHLERYFSLKEVSKDEKMQATMVVLEGKALNWFQWWETCNQNPSWEEFKVAVVRRFCWDNY